MTTSNGIWIIGYGSLIFKPPPLYSLRITGTLEGFVRRFWQSSTDHRGTAAHPGRVVTLVSLDDLKQDEVFHNDLQKYELNHYDEPDVESTSPEQTPLKSKAKEVSDLDEADLKVWGVAYYIAPENVLEVKQYLDIREQDGYTTHDAQFYAEATLSGVASAAADIEAGSIDAKPDLQLARKLPELEELISQGIELGPEFKPVHLDVLRTLAKSNNGHYVIHSMIYIGTVSNSSFVGPENISKTAYTIKTSRGDSGDNYEYLWKLVHAVRDLTKGMTKDRYLEDLLRETESL